MSTETGVTLTNMNGGSALNYLLLGFVNIFWIPTAMKIGRRPVFLVSTAICMCAGIWLGYFNGTASWMLAMTLNGVGTAAYQAVIQLSVFDMFYTHQRGRMLSFYLFGQQLGSILGLITGGSIADGPGWRWSQYIVAIIDGGVLVLLFLTFEETLFPRFLFSSVNGSVVRTGRPVSTVANTKDVENTLTSTESPSEPEIDNGMAPQFPKRTYMEKLKPWVYFPQDKTSYWQYFRRPFLLFTFPNIVIAGVIFAFGCTAGIVSFNTISEIMTEPPYNWSTTSTGLIFLAALVGNFVGWATGVLSDYIVIFLARRNHGVKEPEMRLWTLCFSFVYAAVGYQLYGWGANGGLHWMTVAFGVGCMIAHQVSACSIATAYAMECFPGVRSYMTLTVCLNNTDLFYRSPENLSSCWPSARRASTLPSRTLSNHSSMPPTTATRSCSLGSVYCARCWLLSRRICMARRGDGMQHRNGDGGWRRGSYNRRLEHRDQGLQYSRARSIVVKLFHNHPVRTETIVESIFFWSVT